MKEIIKKILCFIGIHTLIRDEVLWRNRFYPQTNEKFIIRQCMDCGKVVYINKKL